MNCQGWSKLNYSIFPALNKFLLMIMPQELLFSWWRQRFLMPRENIFVAHEIFKRHLEFVKKDIVFCEKDSYLLTKRHCLLMKRQLSFNIFMRNRISSHAEQNIEPCRAKHETVMNKCLIAPHFRGNRWGRELFCNSIRLREGWHCYWAVIEL